MRYESKMKNNLQINEAASALLQSVLQIADFENVAEWDKNATEQINNLLISNSDLSNNLIKAERELNYAKANHNSKPFIKRLFSSRAPIRKAEAEIQDIKENILENKSLAEQLQDWIDRTPDDVSQAKAMLTELKLIKKELGIQKKEISASIRSTNQIARAKNSQIANQYFVNSKFKQVQRIGVRAEKESALRIHESEKKIIEHQLLEVDKMILWIERIKISK